MAKYLILRTIDREARGNALAWFGVVDLPDGVPIAPSKPLLLDKEHARGLEALLGEMNGTHGGVEGAPKAASQTARQSPSPPRSSGGLPVTSGS